MIVYNSSERINLEQWIYFDFGVLSSYFELNHGHAGLPWSQNVSSFCDSYDYILEHIKHMQRNLNPVDKQLRSLMPFFSKTLFGFPIIFENSVVKIIIKGSNYTNYFKSADFILKECHMIKQRSYTQILNQKLESL